MAFDKELDKEIYSEEKEFDTTRIKVSIMSYNEGPKKMQISRENRNMKTGEFTFAKLGRLTLTELEAILPMIEKVKSHF